MEPNIAFRPMDLARFDAAKMAKVGVFDSERLLVGLNCFEAGQKHALHSHAGSDKLYVVVEGEARFTLGGDSAALSPGFAAVAPSGVPHALENVGSGRLVVLVAMAPPPHGS